MKLACIVQRYGTDIAGGSEAHCRELAERLSASHDVTVLTSCARDYVTWANECPPGETRERGVRVLRFPVRRPRRVKRFQDLSDEVFDGGEPRERQEEWFRENGPDLPGLLDHLGEHGTHYDLLLFWTFRYAPSYFGLPLVAARSVLVPTAERDAAIDLDVAAEFFRLPAGYLFLTPEEEALVSARAGRELRPSATIGIGIDPVSSSGHRDESSPLDLARGAAVQTLGRFGIPPDYVLYLGRVDRNKGCDTLLQYFYEYALLFERATLVLAGPTKMQIPEHPRIRALGYVSSEDRHALLSQARALIVPSRYESLSIVLLEAWNHAVPAIVNADCDVLKGQVRRANGGLYYRTGREFNDVLRYVLSHEDERSTIGRQGLAYVDREYRWPTVLGRVEHLLAEVRSRANTKPAAQP